MKKIILITLTVFIYSCASTISPVAMKYKNESDVQLNQIQNRDIGESLITKSEELYQDAYIITNTSPFKIKLLDFPYSNGDVLPLSGTKEKYNLYFKGNHSINNMVYTAGIAENKETGELMPFTNSANGFGLKEIDGFSAKKTIYYEENCTKCLKQEFIYNGISNNSTKFIYREYINNLARPAFNQEIQYDLNESKTIGFKGLRIEILNATNSNIKYKILSDFN